MKRIYRNICDILQFRMRVKEDAEENSYFFISSYIEILPKNNWFIEEAYRKVNCYTSEQIKMLQKNDSSIPIGDERSGARWNWNALNRQILSHNQNTYINHINTSYIDCVCSAILCTYLHAPSRHIVTHTHVMLRSYDNGSIFFLLANKNSQNTTNYIIY